MSNYLGLDIGYSKRLASSLRAVKFWVDVEAERRE